MIINNVYREGPVATYLFIIISTHTTLSSKQLLSTIQILLRQSATKLLSLVSSLYIYVFIFHLPVMLLAQPYAGLKVLGNHCVMLGGDKFYVMV